MHTFSTRQLLIIGVIHDIVVAGGDREEIFV